MGIPIQILQAQTSSSEFTKWAIFLRMKKEQELEVVRRDEYYLAQIACILWNVNSKHGRKLKDFLFNFVPKKEQKNIPPELRAQMSQNFWMSIVGFEKTPVSVKKK